jgi:hypothetical protein
MSFVFVPHSPCVLISSSSFIMAISEALQEKMQNNNTNIDSTANTCDLCGVESQALKRCSRCKTAHYCGAECQKNAWTRHKLECRTNSTAEDARAHSKMLRKAKKKGTPIVCVSTTAFGPVAPGLPIPDGVPPNFSLKQEATLNLREGPSRSGKNLGNMQYEASYRAYYDDIVENESIWMSFFEHPANTEHAEQIPGQWLLFIDNVATYRIVKSFSIWKQRCLHFTDAIATSICQTKCLAWIAWSSK